jgi:hypothetical protein
MKTTKDDVRKLLDETIIFGRVLDSMRRPIGGVVERFGREKFADLKSDDIKEIQRNATYPPAPRRRRGPVKLTVKD